MSYRPEQFQRTYQQTLAQFDLVPYIFIGFLAGVVALLTTVVLAEGGVPSDRALWFGQLVAGAGLLGVIWPFLASLLAAAWEVWRL